jgi:hypothetical protein
MMMTMTMMEVITYGPLLQACQAALVLMMSHGICCSIIMYYDLTAKWRDYSLNKNRTATLRDYSLCWKSFCVDMLLLFIPFMTACFAWNADKINNSQDTLVDSSAKLVCGYLLGKCWAGAVHYVLHFPALYKFHRRHHRNPKSIVASAAWEDSFVEYAIMELPSFGLTVWLFPTHFAIHLFHFCLHGWDGAAGHSGFSGAPGIFGYMFDGEYHYYHHLYLTVNYAEIEFFDKIMGTHHSQRKMPLAA